jgi:hypothetical protein
MKTQNRAVLGFGVTTQPNAHTHIHRGGQASPEGNFQARTASVIG